jgi:GTPase SAR1 family protein
LEHRPQIQIDLKEGNDIEEPDISRFELHRQNLAELFATSPMIPLQRCKIYLVGWGGSGKTTLKRALKRTRGSVPIFGPLLAYSSRHEEDRQCDPDRETVGVEVNCQNSPLLMPDESLPSPKQVELVKIGGEEFSLWDYGGQVEYYASYDLVSRPHVLDV